MIINHRKNVAFELAFPMVDSASPANFKTGLSPVDTAYYKDGAGAWTALAITDTAAEIGTTGAYEIALTAAELNHDWVIIKFTSAGAADTLITFKMLATETHTWHVAKTGLDTNTGHSFDDAKLTIGAAVTAAASGDTIIIWPGDYEENVVLTGKALTLLGTSRNKSRIIKTTGKGITLDDNCIVKNLAVESLEMSSDGIGIYAIIKTNIVIEDCDIYGAYDGLNINSTSHILIRNCRIRGKYDGCNFGSVTGLIAENCIFSTDGTYSTETSARAALVSGGDCVFKNCIFLTSRDDTSSQNVGGVDNSGDGIIAFINCIFKVSGGANDTGICFGIKSNNASARTSLQNCSFYCVSPAASVVYDLYNIGGKMVVSTCAYSTTSGTVIDVVDASGRVDVGSWLGGAVTAGAIPSAAADAAGGLPISDAGGLDLDAIKTKTDNLPEAKTG